MTQPAMLKFSLDVIGNNLWKATSKGSLDCVAYSPVYARITGSVPAGILLAQILYWFRPDKKGLVKLRVKRNGRLLLAKSTKEWVEETGLTPKQVRSAMARLVDLGFVETKRHRFAGKVVVHVFLKEQAVLHGVALSYIKEPETQSPEKGVP